MSVLVVEDDPNLNETLCRLLQRQDLRTVSALTGADALNQLSTAQPDIVLLDYTLPDVTAEHVLEHIGVLDEMPPVIVMTGHGSEAIASNMLELGACDYVVKDVEFASHVQRSVLHAARDLMQRRALHEAVERWQRTYDAIPDMICILDADQRIVSANEAMADRLNTSAAELAGRCCYEAIHGLEQPPDGCPFRLLNGSGTKSVEMSEPRLDGVFTVTVTPLQHRGEQRTGAVHVMHDISQQRLTEDELRRRRTELESLFNLARRDFATDQELISFAVEEAVQLTGSEVGYAHFLSEDQVDLRLFAWSRKTLEDCTAPISPVYPLGEAGIWADCVRERRPVIHNDYPAEPKHKGYPEGHIPIKRHMSVPVMDGDRVVLVAGVGNKKEPYDETDATNFQLFMTEVWQLYRRRRAEFEVLSANAELEKRVEERTRQLRAIVDELDAFSYSVSHDLQTPLRNVDQYSAYLMEGHAHALDQEGRRYLERIRAGVARMARMIQALLTLSRQTQAEPVWSEADLSAIAQEVIEELREAEPDRQVEVRIEPDVMASCDGGYARVVLQNLLGNAWKFTRSVPAPVIEFGGTERDGTRAYYVRDNGPGFDASQAQRLFGAFQRYCDDPTIPGLGIGLATVRRVIRKHGGRIWAESAPGKGATFTFTFGEKDAAP
jgi:PAS domain S-box-containing protein